VASATSSTVACALQASPGTTMLGLRIMPSSVTRWRYSCSKTARRTSSVSMPRARFGYCKSRARQAESSARSTGEMETGMYPLTMDPSRLMNCSMCRLTAQTSLDSKRSQVSWHCLHEGRI